MQTKKWEKVIEQLQTMLNQWKSRQSGEYTKSIPLGMFCTEKLLVLRGASLVNNQVWKTVSWKLKQARTR